MAAVVVCVGVQKKYSSEYYFECYPKIWILDNTKASSAKSDDLVIKMEVDFQSYDRPKDNMNSKFVTHQVTNSNLGYSETEEVITISDDEAYLDFNSEVVTIELSDDDDDWNSPEFCKSSTSNKSVNKENSFINEINLSSKNLSELDQNLREDVEISDFNKHGESDILVHQRQLRQNDKLYPTSESATSNSNITNLTTENLEFVNNHDHTTNSFEDHLSNSSVSSHDEIIIPFSKKNNSVNMSDKSKEFGTSNEIASTFSDKNELNIKNIKSETQPIGRTLYTEPKRIVHRPKRMRGREEWFKEQNVPVPSPSSSKELPKDKSSSKYSKKDKQGTKRTKRKQIYKKGKVSHTSKKWSDSMVIGALTKESPLASFKIPKKLPSDKPPALAVNKEISKPTKTNQTSSLNKKIPSITRKPDKYASRSAFLITEMSTKEKNPVSRKLIPSPSIQATNVNNSNNVKHNLPFDVNTKKIIKKPVANVKSLNVNDSNTKVPSVISNSDQMEGEPCTQKYVKTRDNLQLNTNTTCNDTLSGMSEKVPVADSSLPGNKNSPLNQELLFSNKSEQLCDKNTSLMPLKTNFKPNKNGESLLNHQISKINPITDNKDKKSNNLIVSATFSDVMTEASNKRFEYKEVTSIIKRVVEWKDKWLKEQQTMSKPPPILIDGVRPLPLHFNSFDHYVSSFSQVLLLELWEKVYQNSKPIWRDKKRIVNKFYFIIVSSTNNSDMTEYRCEALINKLSFTPETGKLVLLHIQDKNTNSYHPMLGYIFFHSVQNNKNEINPELKKIDQMWIENAELWQFSVFVKHRHAFHPFLKKIMKGYGICSILKYLNLVNGFQNLKSSSLCSNILKPYPSSFFSNYPNVCPTSCFNERQSSIIEGISAELQKNDTAPKIFLLQGLPGTGKTHVVYGLLNELIFGHCPQLKVLVVAPSSTAVDEIGSRVVELIERSSYRSLQIKLLRLGLQSKVSQKMQPYTLDAQYAENIIDKEREIEQFQNYILPLLNQNNDEAQLKLKSLIEKYQRLRNELDLLKSNKENYQCHLLEKSQIVFTTLSWCSWLLLTKACKPYSATSFSCCVIDDAAQCSEMEILQLLALDINKLILVGDPLQLPADILSKTAASLGWGRSLFERFISYFSKTGQKNLFITLTEQFRMHSEICSFPSKYFYNDQLTTAGNLDQIYENFPIYPYSVYVVQESEFFENSRVETVVNLGIQFLLIKSSLSIGIIVPNQKKKDLYSKWIRLMKSDPVYELIDVNVVENFQGREMDVVILACDHDGELSSFLLDSRKLNVALTRARLCLIVCIFSTASLLKTEWQQLKEDATNRNFLWMFQNYKEIHLINKCT
ncbi:probable helicase senataxin [Trichonephila clavata]|uniref:Probable helicase senataxin n=1 Tax=Trichonephila clavata TaxID=2740835 RepID=A0A8X6LHP2_TRICU|nr:probable helicase senataxin [Trichonephila clavata]